MAASLKSSGSQPSELSSVRVTSAFSAFCRREEPAKMASSVLRARRTRPDCSPSTQRKASAMFDLPEPFGPTMAVIPSANSKRVREAKVLYPCSSRDLRRSGIESYFVERFFIILFVKLRSTPGFPAQREQPSAPQLACWSLLPGHRSCHLLALPRRRPWHGQGRSS